MISSFIKLEKKCNHVSIRLYLVKNVLYMKKKMILLIVNELK